MDMTVERAREIATDRDATIKELRRALKEVHEAFMFPRRRTHPDNDSASCRKGHK